MLMIQYYYLMLRCGVGGDSTTSFETGATAWRKHPLLRIQDTAAFRVRELLKYSQSFGYSFEILVSNNYFWLARG